jgi:hypothetical protein
MLIVYLLLVVVWLWCHSLIFDKHLSTLECHDAHLILLHDTLLLL